jgi:hypothetical protein
MTILGFDPPTVSALAASATAFIAAVAAAFAFVQVRHAAKTRQEQAQAYVAVYAEPSVAVHGSFDLKEFPSQARFGLLSQAKSGALGGTSCPDEFS